MDKFKGDSPQWPMDKGITLALSGPMDKGRVGEIQVSGRCFSA